MPPKAQAQRRMTQAQNEQVFDVGVVGRKTGITLAERERDAHGFEAVDSLFSSPEKDINNVSINGANGRHHAESDEEEEQEMEIDDESQMGPATILKQRQSRPSLPRARSPIKTHLQSPARQNPHIGLASSPARGSIVPAREPNPPKSVNRKLDFSKASSIKINPTSKGQPKVNGTKPRNGKLTNGRSRANDSDEEDEPRPRGNRNQPQEQEVEEEEPDEPMDVLDAGIDEVENANDDQDDPPIEPEPEFEEEQEEEEQPIPQPKSPEQPKKRRGRKPKSLIVQEDEGEPSVSKAVLARTKDVNDALVKKKQRGWPARASSPIEENEPPRKAQKRRPERQSGSSVEEEQEQETEENASERKTKRQRTEEKESKATSSKPIATKEKGKPGRKRKSSGVGIEEPVVQRGPPLPKGRGLVALRREGEDSMRITRSGRHSYGPLKWWQGEHAVRSGVDVFEDKGQKFVMPVIQGVVRAEEPKDQPTRKRRGRPSKQRGRPGRRVSAIPEEEEIERDDWEFDPGRIAGECLYWRPEYETEPADEDQLEVTEEELAISEAAIQLKDIKDATFRFAKTLTLPFFGSGVVDMPPGSEKRTKNSRKMQMVFFVHKGSVDVTVAQTEFRIGMGGMWFVPRGNHYSITNNTDKPARIFFAQGCEVLVQGEGGDAEETQMG
ncbi:Mif2/CENP-C like-domain-containing protein [Daldinia caldariorum]|uniref:Mif2/CENP-C like-domain-containing protein n=1 Tax=Daldinia caldariorum TaxID=326644 RepID=UPI0020072832|nr:Mif2/CENP-C like-domain-containing protein [Daldinia caldariorum]KAI1471412.1 Mif2/CENP-C like-domain-containing protein [Daldinia caldariorum]